MSASINYMYAVARILGVEINEMFRLEESSILYRLTTDGLEWFDDYDKEWRIDSTKLRCILTGEIKIVNGLWKPKLNEKFYVPSVQLGSFVEYRWGDKPMENKIYEAGIIFETKEEATEMAQKLREFIRNERGMGC